MNFAIYRILGNSLPPRHDAESTLRNLSYILEHEEPLPDCTKHWILNGLIDTALDAACRRVIEAAGQECHYLPFDNDGYRLQFLDASGMPEDLQGNYPPNFDPTLIRNRLAIEWIYRHKSIAAININRARNLAIALGRQHARWTIPLDGGCYFNIKDWLELTRSLHADSSSLYALIPMLRLESNTGFIEVPGSYPIEPQIAFRDDAPDRFDERLRYGNRNKAEFLVRIAVPGPWHTWNAADWDSFVPVAPEAPGRFIQAGRAYRLETGASPKVESHERQRHAARFEGVVGITQTLDRQALQNRFASVSGTMPPSLQIQAELLIRCDQILDHWQRTVSDQGWQALQTLWVLPLLTDGGETRKRRLGQAEALLRFMESSKDGMAASLAMDANGIWMHLLKLALALYTEQWALASRLLNYAPVRFIANQTRNASGMPLNFADSINQANAWVILARLSAFAGHDLARYQGVQGESIAALLAQIGQTGPESPEWRARPEHYALWHSRLNALLMGETQPYSPIDSADLMPVAWQLLAEPVQSDP
ncbi:hypothetical protein [Arenimonas sp.]|uniref:hypothetical protein n=1 Tax=Arenimonas sp. TaxID=1872635 RepID=UPI0037BFE9C5